MRASFAARGTAGSTSKRLDLGREAKPPRRGRVVERLHAEPVACEQHGRCSAVPDREREHAVQPIEHAGAPLRVRGEQNLGVRLGVELAAERAQLLAQLDVVVDLAVEGQPQRPVRARHRAVAGG